MTVHIGTSGWHYRHWVGPFYPPGLRPRQMLKYYAVEFETVEVNSSFYRLPRPETLVEWRDSTPAFFVFAFKASRYLTHMKKLKDAHEALSQVVDRARMLTPKLGPVLFQLPPGWRVDAERLRSFLAQLPAEVPAAFEFRDPSWFTQEVYGLLREHEAAFCIYDLGGRTSPCEVTAPFVYVRLHGPGGAYQGSYSNQALEQWAEAISRWEAQGKEVYCFFDNDECAYAVANARELKRLVAATASR